MTDFKSLLAIIACSIMLFACGGAKAPEDVATEFITNIYNAKTDDAVAMLYLDEEKEADEKDMMTKKFNGMLPQQKKVISYQYHVHDKNLIHKHSLLNNNVYLI